MVSAIVKLVPIRVQIMFTLFMFTLCRELVVVVVVVVVNDYGNHPWLAN